MAGRTRPQGIAKRERGREVARWLLAAAFLGAGVLHVRDPGFFLPIVPAWVPVPRLTVVLTGWCEVAGAVGLAVPRLRWWAGLMLALYSVCVYPANLHHAFGHVAVNGGRLGWGYHGPRLALQPVIVWWCLFAGRVVDWPFRSRAPAAPARDRSPGPTG